MKFNFRKITSAIASTAMLGSTVALAAAANFPAPFVEDGAADVAIVYGNSLDLVAVTDISTALSSALASSGSGAVSASEEAYALFTSSTPLQLNNSLNSVRTSVMDSNLPTALGDTEFSGNVDATASFQLTLGSNPRVIYAKEPTSSSEPSVGLYFGGTSAANYLYNATVTFDEAVNFTHSDSEGESISLFGQDFTVSSASDINSLVLFKSAETVFLSVGSATSVPSQTVEVEGETYTIELIAASDTSATIKVTNSAGRSDQKEINEASSKKILGIEVAVNMADESTATNVIQAEVLVGANRLTLENGNEVKIGTESTAIDGTKVTFYNASNVINGDSVDQLLKMSIQVFAEDGSHDFLVAGEEFVDPVFGSFRLMFDGLAVDIEDTENREEIIISPSGNDMSSITFTSWEEETLENWEWMSNETQSAKLVDGDSYPLVVRELGIINKSAHVVVGNEDEGMLLELTGLTNSTDTSTRDEIVFENLVTGQEYSAKSTSEGTGTVSIGGNEYTFTYWDNRNGDGSAHVRLNYPDSTSGGLVLYPTIETSKGANLAFYEPLTIDLNNMDGTGTDATTIKFPDGDAYTDVTVALNELGNFTVSGQVLGNGTLAKSVTIGTLTYNFTYASRNTTTVYLVEGGANVLRPSIVLFEAKDEADVYQTVIVETAGAGTTDTPVSVNEVSFSWNGDADMKNSAYGDGFRSEENEDLYLKLDQWGTLSTIDKTDSDQLVVTLSYPEEQAVAEIYIDSLAEGSGSSSLGDVKIMDDELASSGMSTKNLIVVGGSCVNTAASTLLGGAGCGASWTAATGAGQGEWIIQTFANPWASTKVATLVAGWEQGDTANAATYLKTHDDVSTAVGSKGTGTTSTSGTFTQA